MATAWRLSSSSEVESGNLIDSLLCEVSELWEMLTPCTDFVLLFYNEHCLSVLFI
jgi:hypothetical protein